MYINAKIHFLTIPIPHAYIFSPNVMQIIYRFRQHYKKSSRLLFTCRLSSCLLQEINSKETVRCFFLPHTPKSTHLLYKKPNKQSEGICIMPGVKFISTFYLHGLLTDKRLSGFQLFFMFWYNSESIQNYSKEYVHKLLNENRYSKFFLNVVLTFWYQFM